MVEACGVRVGTLRARTFSSGPLPLICDWMKRITHPPRKKINIPIIDTPVTEHTIMTILVVDSFCDTGVDDVDRSGDGDVDGMDEVADDGLDVGADDGMDEGADDRMDVNEGGDDGMDEGDNEGDNDGMDEGVGFAHILTVFLVDPDTIRDPSWL